MFEDIPYEYEVDGHRDAEHREGSQDSVYTYPEEEIEETHLQEIIEYVSPRKPRSVSGRGLLLEREMGREIIVGAETHQIAYGEGYVYINPVLQYQVDGVMNGHCQNTNDSEPDELP